MRATTIMLLAIGALVLAHWAHGKPTVSPKMVVELAFALIVIAALDQGDTEPVARGFAWLFLAGPGRKVMRLLGVKAEQP